MKTKLITDHSDYWLLVDLEATIPAFAHFYVSDRRTIHKNRWKDTDALKREFNWYYLIVGHLPKSNAPFLERVALMPLITGPFSGRDTPIDYCPPKDTANAIWGSCFDYKDIEESYEGLTIRDRVKEACYRVEQIEASSGKYTEEDLRKALHKGKEIGSNNWLNDYDFNYKKAEEDCDNYIQSLSTPAVPKDFEPEMVIGYMGGSFKRGKKSTMIEELKTIMVDDIPVIQGQWIF